MKRLSTFWRRLCWIVTLSAAAAGCFGTGGSYVNEHFEDDHVGYGVGEPGDGWQTVRLEGVNVAWHQPALAAGLLINSHCEGVGDSPLEGLTGELLMGTTEREVLQQTLVPWSGREALETIATCKLDGVPRKRAMFVLKKDGCVYDVVYDASPATFDAGLDGYRRVKAGLDVGPRRDRG